MKVVINTEKDGNAPFGPLKMRLGEAKNVAVRLKAMRAINRLTYVYEMNLVNIHSQINNLCGKHPVNKNGCMNCDSKACV
mmetsp:Transcript_20994/g.25987  ORF Transcript_20994/g.25987 Transcript_20994/m.25987 type:complete len:80 (-) Transcript_20994:182-421(-)